MKIKKDWRRSLHGLKVREIKRIFKSFPRCSLGAGLEIGAGDGFQSRLLSRYVKHLYATDYNNARLKAKNRNGITYETCDAEQIKTYFEDNTFDFIFSSSLLEHLPDPQKVLNEVRQLLRDDGITVHCVPNPFWKFSQLAMFYPNLFVLLLEKITSSGWIGKMIKMKKKSVRQFVYVNNEFENNPKASFRRYSWLWPPVHGVSKSHLREFFAFRKRRWINEFKQARFDVVKVIPGPISSGYGFGLEGLGSILEKIGISSEYIYVAVKKGKRSPYLKYFS